MFIVYSVYVSLSSSLSPTPPYFLLPASCYYSAPSLVQSSFWEEKRAKTCDWPGGGSSFPFPCSRYSCLRLRWQGPELTRRTGVRCPNSGVKSLGYFSLQPVSVLPFTLLLWDMTFYRRWIGLSFVYFLLPVQRCVKVFGESVRLCARRQGTRLTWQILTDCETGKANF